MVSRGRQGNRGYGAARAIIGNGRDAFGDLRNMELTVEVIGGSGAVTAVIHSIENRSGDAIVRTE
jgi:hypothetical protein